MNVVFAQISHAGFEMPANLGLGKVVHAHWAAHGPTLRAMGLNFRQREHVSALWTVEEPVDRRIVAMYRLVQVLLEFGEEFPPKMAGILGVSTFEHSQEMLDFLMHGQHSAAFRKGFFAPLTFYGDPAAVSHVLIARINVVIVAPGLLTCDTGSVYLDRLNGL